MVARAWPVSVEVIQDWLLAAPRSSAPKKSGIWKWRITLMLPCHIWQAPLIRRLITYILDKLLSVALFLFALIP